MANVVKRADVRMIQAGDRAGFALKSLAQIRPIHQMCSQDFDGNSSAETGITSAVNLTHTTRTE
jgi:hypothetical protein